MPRSLSRIGDITSFAGRRLFIARRYPDMKSLFLSVFFASAAATSASAQMMASAGNSPSYVEAASAATEWYDCAGTFTINSADAKYTFTGLQLRKIDGQSFEIKGKGDAAIPAMLLHIRTLNPDLILRPGMVYVSEGNLEAGETFNLALLSAPNQPLLSSTDAGCTLKIGSARGGSVKGEMEGQLLTAAGVVQPFTANFDVIDARYGR